MKKLVELDDHEAVLVMCALRYYEANHFTANEVDLLVQRINCPDEPTQPWEIQRAHENGVSLQRQPRRGRYAEEWWKVSPHPRRLDWHRYEYRIGIPDTPPMKKWEIQKAFEEGAVMEYIMLPSAMNPTVGRSWQSHLASELNWALYDYRVMS